MNLNRHFDLEDRHAFLSASKSEWVNYDEDKMLRVFTQSQAAAKGDRLHKLASILIAEGVKLPRKAITLNMYVNDAIGFRMTPEQPLYYTDNAFGTADALKFANNLLRIHDLKTGFTPAKFRQLHVYAAYFCLEYGFRPFDIEMEFRIYQSDQVQIEQGDPDVIFRIMEKAKFFDRIIEQAKEEARL